MCAMKRLFSSLMGNSSQFVVLSAHDWIEGDIYRTQKQITAYLGGQAVLLLKSYNLKGYKMLMTCSTSLLYPAYVVFLTGSFQQQSFGSFSLAQYSGFCSLKQLGKLSRPSPFTSSFARVEFGTYLNFCSSFRTALRHCGWKTSVASLLMAEWPRPVCCSMVPTTGALQQCSGISPPVLVDHPDGCKSAEEVSAKCNPGFLFFFILWSGFSALDEPQSEGGTQRMHVCC